MNRTILAAVPLALVWCEARGDDIKTYSDPENAFSIKLSGEWKSGRHRAKDHTSTFLKTPSGTAVLNVHVYPMGSYADALTNPKLGPGVDREAFEKTAVIEFSKPYMDVWVDGARQQQNQNVRTGRIAATTFQGRRAARGEIRYDGPDGAPRTGYALFFLGKKHVFFVTMTSRDAAGTDQVEAALKTFRAEGV
jgi:hypothetical protein